MFTDPQSVTLATVAQSLPRTATEDSTSTYTKDDETVQMTISHLLSNKGRMRREVRLDFTKIASDPFTANQSRKITSTASFVINEPSDAALTNTEVLNNCKALRDWLSDANLTKVIAGES